jgi:hypothetical protein
LEPWLAAYYTQLLFATFMLAILLAAALVLGWLLYVQPSAQQMQLGPSTAAAISGSAAASAVGGPSIKASGGGKPKKHKGSKAKGSAAAAAAMAVLQQPQPNSELAGSNDMAAASEGRRAHPKTQGRDGSIEGQQRRQPEQQEQQQRRAEVPAKYGQAQQPEVGQHGQQQEASPPLQQQPQQALPPLSSHDSSQLSQQHTEDPGSLMSRRGSASEGGPGLSYGASRSYVDETGAVVIGRLRVGPCVLGYGSAGEGRVALLVVCQPWCCSHGAAGGGVVCRALEYIVGGQLGERLVGSAPPA